MFPSDQCRLPFPARIFAANSASKVVLFFIAAVTASISFWVHLKAGFTFPNPWNDESWMLWGSISFLENNSPFSEYLNFERPVFAFPSFAVAMGLVFKVFGFSFALARWISWALTMGAYFCVLRMVSKLTFPLISAAASSLFFLGAAVVVAGNMVRPEALVLFLGALSFAVLDHSRPWKALAVASCCGIFHTTGLLFFIGISATATALLLRDRRRPSRPTRSDCWVAAVALAILVAHASVIASHWHYYLMDIRATVQVDPPGGAFSRIFASSMTPWFSVAAILGIANLWLKPARIPWIAFGCVCLLIPSVRLQMWYDVYRQMGFMVLALALPTAAADLAAFFAGRIAPKSRSIVRGARWVAFLLPLALMLRFCQRHDWITGPNNYPQKLQWGWGMRFDDRPYIFASDIDAIENALRPYAGSGKTLRLFSMPEADALFFRDRLPDNVIPYQAVWSQTKPDLFLFRASRHYPDWWRTQYVEKHAKRFGISWDRPFHERDGTEFWVLHDPSLPVPSLTSETP